jgi:hypothetical protein
VIEAAEPGGRTSGYDRSTFVTGMTNTKYTPIEALERSYRCGFCATTDPRGDNGKA